MDAKALAYLACFVQHRRGRRRELGFSLEMMIDDR
jgi:hypothetical protein